MTQESDEPTPSSSGKESSEGEADYGRNLDDLIPEWNSDLAAELDKWKQGDLLEGAPRFWASPAGEDPVLSTEYDHDWTVTGDAGDAGWVVVTTQTCDIGVGGSGRKQPFFDVSPIFRLSDDLDAGNVRTIMNWGVTYLAPLSPPRLTGNWVADLRLTMPVSKGLLAGREPVEGFSSERARLDFGEFLGIRRRRPSVHDVLTGDFLKSLTDYMKATEKNRPEWWQNVDQLRLWIDGDRLNPAGVGLIVIQMLELSEEQREVWRRWKRSGDRILREYGITFAPILFSSLDELNARVYRDSIPLRIPDLGRPPAW